MAAGDLVYFVIPAADAERAKAFYGGLFGWEFSTGNAPGGFNVEGSSPPRGTASLAAAARGSAASRGGPRLRRR